jgi:hypothetical protein
LYFNDTVYIGWVQDGEVLEAAAVDPQQGTIRSHLSADDRRAILEILQDTHRELAEYWRSHA